MGKTAVTELIGIESNEMKSSLKSKRKGEDLWDFHILYGCATS